MFNIILMTNNSPRNYMNKNTNSVLTVSGAFREESSIIYPDILIETSNDVSHINYLHITEFGRYYFVEDIISVRTNLWRFKCSVDPLMSFKDQLLTCQGIVRRGEQDSLQNLMLDDGSFRVYSDPYIVTKNFPGGFANPSYVLAVAGGAQSE